MNGVFEDDEPKNFDEEKLRSLPTVFKREGGTITAGNASKLNDGGSAIIISNKDAIKKHNWKPLAKIIGYSDAEVPPIDFCIAPAKAMK